jgi:hypothetical protein
VTSLFALGLAWLTVQLRHGHVQRLRRLPQPEWPASDGDRLNEQDWIEEHQTGPL